MIQEADIVQWSFIMSVNFAEAEYSQQKCWLCDMIMSERNLNLF